MHTLILTCEKLFKLLSIDLEQVAESLAYVPIEGQVGPVLHATLNHHIAKLDLLARSDLQLEQFVAALLILYSRHDDQVYSFAQFNQIFLGEVFDFLNTWRCIKRLIIRA